MSFYRSPKTTNEQKQAASSEDQGVKVRPKRRAKNLPDTWDDIHVARRGDKRNKTKRGKSRCPE